MPHPAEYFKTWIEIDATRLRRNLAVFRAIAGKNVVCMAIVKANAYGHGLAETAKILARTPGIFFGVDSIDEALAVSRIAPRHPILIVGYIPPSRLPEAVAHRFRIAAYSREILSKIVSLAKRRGLPKPIIHLKIETGTNRLGLTVAELRKISALPPIEGIYTHFAETEDPKSTFYTEQIAVLEHARALLQKRGVEPEYIHTASTAAILQYPEARYNMMRLGLGIYGLWPSHDVQRAVKNRIALQPVLAWKTRIAQVKTLRAGESVGYDRAYRARNAKKIAVLPVGYSDGYDRGLSQKGEVFIRGKRARVIGKVCMNMMMVDISGISAKVNDEVILLGGAGGSAITADEIAKKIGTINYEVVSRINPLIPRIIVL